MMRPMMPPNAQGGAPASAPLDWSRTPMASAFIQSGGQGLSNLAQAFDPSQFNGSFGQYLQSFRQAPTPAPAPIPPQGMPPQMPPQGGPPPGMGWQRPDFPGQGHAWGRGFGGAQNNPAFAGWRPQQGRPNG